MSSVTHFVWFSRIYFKPRIHARTEQFVSFVTHFPISKQIFETEFENQKKIRLPNEYYIVPRYRPAPFVDVILVSFVLQTKVTGFGHSLLYILDLGSVLHCKRAKIESPFQIFSGWFIVYARHEMEIKNISESVYNPGQNIWNKIVNPVKLDRARKVWYLLLRAFWLLLPKF